MFTGKWAHDWSWEEGGGGGYKGTYGPMTGAGVRGGGYKGT